MRCLQATTETHPLKIYFCNDGGGFLARTDSLKRHREQRVQNEFPRLMGFLRTGEQDIEKPFSQVIKEKYPESSKKHKLNGC